MNTLRVSELLNLLQVSLQDLRGFKVGLSEREINSLYKEDRYFRKNLDLEIKDISLIIQKLQDRLVLTD